MSKLPSRITVKGSTAHFINSPAELTQCRKCTGWIYQCYINGWKIKVEPTPLNFETEISLRMEGRRIYQTLKFGTDFELENRTLWHITNAHRLTKVLPEHSCKTPTIFEPAPLYETAKSKEPNF